MAMRVCEKCQRHVRDDTCPFCKENPRFNRAALVIGASLAVGPMGVMFDRIFSCKEETVVAPYGAPQPPPDAGLRTAVPAYGLAPPPPMPSDASTKRD